MKIFHILDEITTKNISIVSVAYRHSNQINSKSSKILSSKIDKKYFKSSIFIKTKIKFFFLYFSSVFFFLKKEKPNAIHLHGLWNLNHIIFFFNAKKLNIPIIIQPHGMLLEPAVKSKSVVNYYLKLIIIFFYKLFSKDVAFVAVTKEEMKSIYNYFKTKNIFIYTNPFRSTFKISNKIKKNIIYFGRINKFKNLELIINSFKLANLDEDWKLYIYGIRDDIDYEKHLKKIIKTNNIQNIFFKKPIFDYKKKFKIISESFLNILMSKSEVLSLSVLESLSVGTKSLVNKNISYPKNYKNFLFQVQPSVNSISRKLKELTNKKDLNSTAKKKEIVENFKKIYFQNNKQISLYTDILDLNNNKQNSNISVIYVGLLNILSSFLLPFLITLFAMTNLPIKSVEIGIYGGTGLFLTQVFSMNARAIILSDHKNIEFFNFYNFRFFLSLIFITLFIFAFNYIKIENYEMIAILIPIVFISWINEINYTLLEKSSNQILFKIILFFKILFYCFILLTFFLKNLTIENVLFIYLLNEILIVSFFYQGNFSFKKFNKILYSFKKDYLSFLSTASNSFAIIFWRYSILFYIPKEIAGIIFALFSIASLPGTILNNILGQTLILREDLNIRLKKIENKFNFIQFPVIIFLSVLIYYYSNLSNFLKYLVVFSLIGTIIMFKSIRIRHEQFNKNKKQVFRKDIIYSLSIMPLIIILYNTFGIYGISFAFLISSLSAFIIFNYGFKYR